MHHCAQNAKFHMLGCTGQFTLALILEVTDTPPPTPTTSPVDEFASIMQMLGDGKPGHVYTTAELDAMLQ